MFCHKCGRQVPNGSRFCDKCGTALPSDHVSISTPLQQNPFAEPGIANIAINNDLNNTVKFTCVTLLLLSIIFIVFNIGGISSGLALIDGLFRIPLRILPTAKAVACVLLLISHLGVIIWGIVGFFISFSGECPKISSLIVMISGFLGVVSGMIAGWNVVAEVVPFISGIILFVLSFPYTEKSPIS